MMLRKRQKPAEMLVVKKEDNPRKGRKFWKCVLRHCDYFEWENEMDGMSDGKKAVVPEEVEVQTVASSLNPRRSKSPRSEGVVPAVVSMSAPCSNWSRVSQGSRKHPESVVIVDDEEI